MKIRGFELVTGYDNINLLPKRETKNSAGYDLKVAKETIIKPSEIKLVETGVKAYMLNDEVLYLYNRSSSPIKLGIVVTNGVGVIDSDYYNNESNEGHLLVQVMNITDSDIKLNVEDRIAQCVFGKYLTIDDEVVSDKTRSGGFGSTK